MSKFKDGDVVRALKNIYIILPECDNFHIEKGDEFVLNKFLAESWKEGEFAVMDNKGLVQESDFILSHRVEQTNEEVIERIEKVTEKYKNDPESIPKVSLKTQIDRSGDLIDPVAEDDIRRRYDKDYTPLAASETRSHNVGDSNYADFKIQPWDIWLEYELNPWDADIVKRVLRTKEGQERSLDYEKIIHICEERMRQLKK